MLGKKILLPVPRGRYSIHLTIPNVFVNKTFRMLWNFIFYTGVGCGTQSGITFSETISDVNNTSPCTFVEDKKSFQEIQQLRPSK